MTLPNVWVRRGVALLFLGTLSALASGCGGASAEQPTARWLEVKIEYAMAVTAEATLDPTQDVFFIVTLGNESKRIPDSGVFKLPPDGQWHDVQKSAFFFLNNPSIRVPLNIVMYDDDGVQTHRLFDAGTLVINPQDPLNSFIRQNEEYGIKFSAKLL
ncbi:MAG TPA: hypothetical protein GXX55_05860 [Firmicutes bacterium]|nr:hypothetical protein [Bacillota bacterium]